MKFLNSFIKSKKIIALLICFSIAQFSYSQSDLEQEIKKEIESEVEVKSNIRFSVGTQFMFPKMQFNNASIDNVANIGVSGTFGVSYLFNNHLSLHSGVGYNYYQTKNTLTSYSNTQNSTDISGEDFEFRYQLHGFSETQKLTAINIPIAIQYETSGTFRFYTKIGFEANFFVKQEYESSAENLTTTGFFSEINAELDMPKFVGFGSFEDQEFIVEDLDIENSYNTTVELGVKKLLKKRSALYLGVYAKLGLNTINSKANTNGLISYNSDVPTEFLSASILQAVDGENNSDNKLSQAKLNVFGIAFKYEFSGEKIFNRK